MSFVKSHDGTQLYYKSWGSGEPVVFVHGWPLSSDTWDGIANRVAQAGYQAVAYDRRGFGRSDQPWDGYNYDTMARDLSSVIDELGLKSCHLVGFSMGGGEVVRYSSYRPNATVKSITLISSIVPMLQFSANHQHGVPADALEGIQNDILASRPDFFAKFFPNFYGNGFLSKPVSDATLEWTRNLAMQAGLKPTLDCVDAFGKTDFRDEVTGVRVPTLLIHGTDDQIVPINATSRLAVRLFPNAKLVEIDGGHHGVLVTHESQITEHLLEHLNKSRS